MRLISLILLLASLSLHASQDSLTLMTPQGGPFALETTEGFLASERLIGKNIFLFFGFSSCPDVCPLTLRRMKQLSAKLTPNERANFRFLFISVDNERDTITKLSKLKSTYGESFIGAVDTDEKMTQIATSFGARYRRFKNKKGQLIIDHTDSIFYIDQQGHWAATMPYGSSVEDMLKILQTPTVVSQGAPVPERRAQKLSANTSCDLSQSACTIKWKDQSYTLALSPKPIMTEKEFTAELKSTPGPLKPVMLDLEGVNLNMGYIRPKLSEKAPGEFNAKIILPICELDRMSWVARLILTDKAGSLFYLDYHVTTH